MSKRGGRPKRKLIDRLRAKAWARELERATEKTLSAIADEHRLDRSNLYKVRRGELSPTSYLWLSVRARQVYEIGPAGIPVWPVLRDMEITYDEFSAMLPTDPATTGIHPPTFGSIFGDPTKEASMHAIADYIALIESIVEEELARLVEVEGREDQQVAEKLRQNIADATAVINNYRRQQPWITFCQLIIDFRAMLRLDLSPGLLSMLARLHLGGGRKASGLQTAEQRREFVRDLFDRLARKELMKADMESYGLTPAELIDAALESMR